MLCLELQCRLNSARHYAHAGLGWSIWPKLICLVVTLLLQQNSIPWSMFCSGCWYSSQQVCSEVIEMPGCIKAKAVLHILGKEVEEATGPFQVLHYSQENGCEAPLSPDCCWTCRNGIHWRYTTQVDPTMYVLAIVLLIHKLRNNSPNVKQIWFGTIAGSCEYLRQW